MTKLKTQDQFRDIFLSKLFRSMETQRPVVIRFPDGVDQLLQVTRTIQPILKQTKRIIHHGVFTDQQLTQLSEPYRKWIQERKFDTLYVSVENGYGYLGFFNWDSIKETHARLKVDLNADLNARYYQFDQPKPDYTIAIKSKNHLKLTDYGQHTIAHLFAFTDPKHAQILAGYEFTYNQANKSWQHNKAFGSKADFEYGTNAGMHLIVRADHLELVTYAYDGMTGLEFTEADFTTKPKNADDQTVSYVLKLVRTLIKENIIEVPKSWRKGGNHA